MNSRILFPIFIRPISRSCVREKSFDMNNTKKLKLNLKIDNKEALPVEKDTEKLAKYVCGTNLFIEGGEDVKLKEDSEYPEWLWTIRPSLPLEELSQNTKTYWNRIQRFRKKEQKYLISIQKSKTVHK